MFLEMTELIDIINKMVETVLVGGLTIGYGGVPLSQAITIVFVHYAHYYIAFCLIVGLLYYSVKKRRAK